MAKKTTKKTTKKGQGTPQKPSSSESSTTPNEGSGFQMDQPEAEPAGEGPGQAEHAHRDPSLSMEEFYGPPDGGAEQHDPSPPEALREADAGRSFAGAEPEQHAPPPPEQFRQQVPEDDRQRRERRYQEGGVSTHELIHGSKKSSGSPRVEAGKQPMDVTDSSVHRMFQQMQATDEQANEVNVIRNRAMQLAQEIITRCPQCADRSAALRKAREAFAAAEDAIIRTL